MRFNDSHNYLCCRDLMNFSKSYRPQENPPTPENLSLTSAQKALLLTRSTLVVLTPPLPARVGREKEDGVGEPRVWKGSGLFNLSLTDGGKTPAGCLPYDDEDGILGEPPPASAGRATGELLFIFISQRREMRFCSRRLVPLCVPAHVFIGAVSCKSEVERKVFTMIIFKQIFKFPTGHFANQSHTFPKSNGTRQENELKTHD